MGEQGEYRLQDGFTLIELSIVLVIIGLIVGGVLTGRSLIRAAELRSIITDEQRYVTAVNTFRTKYNEIPGDMADATNFWGTDPGGCPMGYTGSYITTTCNGNGNGLIENSGASVSYTPVLYENYLAWQQLAFARLIPGAYTGTQGPLDYNQNIPGVNVPPTKIPNGGFEWASYIPSTAASYVSPYTQYLLVGGVTNGDLWDLLTPSDGQAIDQKMDDGLPITGSVLEADQGNCLQSYPSWTYNLQSNSPDCVLLFQVHGW